MSRSYKDKEEKYRKTDRNVSKYKRDIHKALDIIETKGGKYLDSLLKDIEWGGSYQEMLVENNTRIYRNVTDPYKIISLLKDVNDWTMLDESCIRSLELNGYSVYEGSQADLMGRMIVFFGTEKETTKDEDQSNLLIEKIHREGDTTYLQTQRLTVIIDNRPDGYVLKWYPGGLKLNNNNIIARNQYTPMPIDQYEVRVTELSNKYRRRVEYEDKSESKYITIPTHSLGRPSSYKSCIEECTALTKKTGKSYSILKVCSITEKLPNGTVRAKEYIVPIKSTKVTSVPLYKDKVVSSSRNKRDGSDKVKTKECSGSTTKKDRCVGTRLKPDGGVYSLPAEKFFEEKKTEKKETKSRYKRSRTHESVKEDFLSRYELELEKSRKKNKYPSQYDEYISELKRNKATHNINLLSMTPYKTNYWVRLPNVYQTDLETLKELDTKGTLSNVKDLLCHLRIYHELGIYVCCQVLNKLMVLDENNYILLPGEVRSMVRNWLDKELILYEDKFGHSIKSGLIYLPKGFDIDFKLYYNMLRKGATTRIKNKWQTKLGGKGSW